MLDTRRFANLDFCLHQSPINEWIVYECFQNSHKRFLVVPEDLHCDLASFSETAFNTTNLLHV